MPNNFSGLIDKIINYLIKGLIFLLPLFFLPWTTEWFEFSKQYLLWLIVPLIIVLWLIKIVLEGEIKFKRTPLDIPILIFLAVTGLSSIFSVDRFSSFFGFYYRFSDAWLGLASLILFYFIITNFAGAKNRLNVFRLVKLLLYSYSIVMIVALVSIFGWLGKYFKSTSIMSLPQFNLTGSTIEGLAIFSLVMTVLLVGLLIYDDRKEKTFVSGLESWYFRIILVLSVILVLLIFPKINLSEQFIDKKLSTEIRLDHINALSIMKESLKEKPILGSGPGTFIYQFSLYRDANFNNSSVWQYRFDKSTSYILEIVTTLGVLGFLSYFLILSLFYYLIFILRKKITAMKNKNNRGMMISLIISFTIITIAQLVYVVNITLLFSFWLLLALIMALAFEIKSKAFREVTIQLGQTGPSEEKLDFKKRQEIFYILLLVIISGWLVLAVTEIKYLIADIVYARTTDKEANITRAIELNPNRFNYQVSLAKFYLNKAQAESLKPSELRDNQLIQASISSSINLGKQAVGLNPNSVVTHETLGMIYRDVRQMTVGSEPWAVESFKKASQLEPSNPVLFTELGKAYLNNNMLAEAEESFRKAMELKSDYHDAKFGLAKVFIKKGEEAKALVILYELSQVALDPEMLYEQGRLFYNQGETEQAINNFLKVLELVPNHSNALYSLGLAYQVLGDKDKALFYFNKVLEFNPDSLDVVNRIDTLEK